MAFTDEDYYPIPDSQYETYETETTARNVRRGDVLDGKKVKDNKTGPKWSDISDTSGKRIMRVYAGTTLSVTRKRETDVSREVSRRADKNRAIARELVNFDPLESMNVAAREIAKNISDYQQTSYWQIGNLLTSQAKAKVELRFRATVEYFAEKEDFDGDLVDVLDDFVADLKEGMLVSHRHRSISRSTNQLSNLIEDCEREAEAEFIHQAERYW